MVDEERFPLIFAAPERWLSEAYEGERVICDKGAVLFVNGKICLFGDVVLSCVTDGLTDATIREPEFTIGPEDEVKVVFQRGGFVAWRGKGKDAAIVGNPVQEELIEKEKERFRQQVEAQQEMTTEDMINEKAAQAKKAIGLDDEQF